MKRLRTPLLTLALVTLALASPASPSRATPREDARVAAEVRQAIVELRLEDAERALRPLLREDAPSEATSLRGTLAFYRGRYAEAATHLAAVASSEQTAAELLPTVTATRDVMRNYVHVTSDDGRFVVSHAPGPDALLVPYALDVLRRADATISRTLGHRVPGPIRLEIYPTAATLAAVSSLTEQDIARSGTIALCKWDRLMVTSPRALLRGYTWADTVAHELVHLVLARASHDRAPVWVQEGFAKFLERAWRRPDEPARLDMDGVSRGILAQAVAANGLLPFERLHPSIALLPSQRDAALAFAQVSSFVDLFHRRHGADGLRDVVARIARGVDAREAFAAVGSASFGQLEQAWRAHVATIRAPDPPRLLPRRLSAGRAEDHEDHADVAEAARRALRLGDLLYARQRYAAASIEYGRALEAAPEDPIVAGRVARAAIRARRFAQARDALNGVVTRHPEYAPAQALMSEALHGLGERDAAIAAAREAIWLNPFAPSPHCVLSEIGPEGSREREARICRSRRR